MKHVDLRPQQGCLFRYPLILLTDGANISYGKVIENGRNVPKRVASSSGEKLR
jgi:hypothetical protein